VKVAEHGITFAAKAVNLCDTLNRTPGTNVRSFFSGMQDIVFVAREDTKSICDRVNGVRQALAQVCSTRI
jgi:hypothetical protein